MAVRANSDVLKKNILVKIIIVLLFYYLFKTLATPKSPSFITPLFVKNIFLNKIKNFKHILNLMPKLPVTLNHDVKFFCHERVLKPELFVQTNQVSNNKNG